MNLVRIFFGAIKGVQRLLFVFLLSASLIFNATFLFWEVGTAAVKSFFAGVSVVYVLAEQVSSLKRKNDGLVKKEAQLASSLSASEKKFAVTSRKLAVVRGELKGVEKARDVAVNQLAEINKRRAKNAKAFGKVHKKVRKRLVRIAGANVAAIAAEVVPVAGAVAVVAISILELREHCKMAGELNEMARLLELEPSNAEENEICGMKISKLGLSDKRINKITKEWNKLFDD